MQPTIEPSYDEAVRDQHERASAQKPFRKQFEKCKTLDQLAVTIEKARKSFDSVPWLSWICDGPGNDTKWTGANKPVAAKQKKLAAIIEDLIANGAELALVDEQGHRSAHALNKLLQLDELTVKQRVALLELAIEHGADPAERIAYPTWASETGPFLGYEPTMSALDIALHDDEHPELLAAIVPHVAKGVLEDAYLRFAIDKLSSYRDVTRIVPLVDRAGQLDRIVTKFRSTSSAALVHFLCEAEVSPACLELLIDRVDVNLAVPGPVSFLVSYRSGVTPSIRVPAGATPLDIVDSILGCVTRAEAVNARRPDKAFYSDGAKRIREAAEAKRALLVARAAKQGTRTDHLDLPPALAGTAEQILRLAKLLGADPAPIRHAMAAVDTDGIGPWSFLRAVVPPFEPELLSPRLDAAPLVELLSAFTSDRWSTQLRKSELPADRRAAAELAVVFHETDGARLLAVKSGGDTQIWKLASDEVTVLAPSISEYLAREIDRWQVR